VEKPKSSWSPLWLSVVTGLCAVLGVIVLLVDSFG
jgi:hypothetical protein